MRLGLLSLCGAVAALGLAGCAGTSPIKSLMGEKPETPSFKAAAFTDLPGWQNDSLNDFRLAMSRSCERFTKLDPTTPIKRGGTVGDWMPFCTELLQPDGDVRRAIENNLMPWRISGPKGTEGLFTGYYEASLKGSRTRGGAYQIPVRARPLDHVIVNLGDFKPELAGQRVTGRLSGEAGAYTLQPYPDRAGIVAGGIPAASDRVLAWVDSAADAFFLEIQGSGRIALDDGTDLHVGYAERNGQPYTAIGKVLVERGEMTKEEASMQSIRAWLAAHPEQAQALLNENRSYIFFREIGRDGPVGAEGIPLTPLRSLAIDKDIWGYGLPFFVAADHPAGADGGAPVQRLLVGQDTGGAIKGAVRGDVYWGYGPEAEANAGIMKSPGIYWVLLPKNVSPVAK